MTWKRPAIRYLGVDSTGTMTFVEPADMPASAGSVGPPAITAFIWKRTA